MSSAPPTRRRTVGLAFVDRLASFGTRPAVLTAEETLTYAALAGRVAAAAAALGPVRRLVLVSGQNTPECLVTYLGALAGGHVVLLAPGDRAQHRDRLVRAWEPDVVAEDTGGVWTVTERRPGTAHALHPDLALLLTTSGSTGSPKLVRLSYENLDANAAAIAAALGIRPSDRAMASLPVHYTYGLSVVHSHLREGAAVVLTSLSVVDPCFWRLFAQARATTLAGVPHTFELLDRSGFADRELPSLRCVTQAGGRLAPEAVVRYAALGAERGWELFVMYGQTEATARMAVLPPALAAARPETIGRPIPGGAFRIEPLGDLDCGLGELVYTGPNVMLGYADYPEDLARGRDLTELRTGDLARIADDGLVEVVGRRSRFAKIVGLRIDLDQVERDLAAAGHPAHCADLGDAVGVLTPEAGSGRAVTDVVSSRHGVPASAVVVVDGEPTPMLSSGKPDYPTIARLAGEHREHREHGAAGGAAAPAAPSAEEAVVALYRELLDAPHATGATSFVDLGGDSLSYVEVSLRLEGLLGHLPEGWHLLPAAELARGSVPAVERHRWRRVETGVVVRAAAVLLILANHTHLADVPGGAHTLLGIAGYNFARFQLTARSRRARLRGIARSAARVLVPSSVWIGGLALVHDSYSWHNALMLNQVLGDHARWSDEWHFWFVEVLLYLLVGLAGLLAIPAVDRAERRWPFAVALALVGAGLLTRYAVVVPDAGPYRGATAYVLIWLFALGWAAQRATALWQRVLVSGLVVATLPGFWPTMPGREATIIAGLLLLLWVPGVRLPGWLGRAAGAVATGSLYIYLTHFSVYPYLMAYSSPLAMGVCVLVGLAYWQAVVRAGRVVGWARARRQAGRGTVSPGQAGGLEASSATRAIAKA